MDYIGSLIGVDVSKYAEYYAVFQLLDKDLLKSMVDEDPLLVTEFADMLKRVMLLTRKQLVKRNKASYLHTLEKIHGLITCELQAAMLL